MSSTLSAKTPVQLLSRSECEAALAAALKKIDANMLAFSDTFPAPYSRQNVYPGIPNNYWTTSFWTGMLWLAYEVTELPKYRDLAERHVASFQDRLARRVETETHDLGFLYILSCIAAHKLVRSESARRIALDAADLLMTRYFEKAGIIQAWGNLSDPKERGRMIIDCCMNLPLLYWASEQTGNASYHVAARKHAEQAARYLVRSDHSTYHTFYMDTETGEPKFGRTNQGFSDTSCWARGQAWGIYGFALSFVYTGDTAFIEMAKKLSDYYLDRLPDDGVAYWDLIFTEGPEERDSSAAAIAACGLLELSKHLPVTDPDRSRYEQEAQRMVSSLASGYTAGAESNGLLLHAVYAKSAGLGINECCIWGDYFYVEALVRLSRSWRTFW
jgi:unsaturated chondroitin disaccharide hydrolase